jgi:hypothetical protein
MRTLLLALLLAGASSGAGVVGGGFAAVAVSPDSKRLAVGGQNRVVYFLDADKTEVQSRIWLGVRVADLAFSKDGSCLLVGDEIDQLHLLDVATGKVLAKAVRVGGFAALPPANLVVVRDLAALDKPRLRFLALDTLADVGEAELPVRPMAWRIDASGKRLLVLGGGKRGDEPVVPGAEVPRDLRGLALWTFRQKNDGQESALYEVDVPTGKVVAQAKSWFTSDFDSTHLARVGGLTYVFNRVNQCAKIGPKGETTMFETSQVVNHALTTSADGKVLYTGGLGGGWVGPVEGARAAFKLDELPGQSEFVNRFAVLGDGGAWAVTSAYRLAKVSRAGRVEKVVPVY